MPIKIIVTDQKYYNEFKNDIGFVSNLGDFTNNLAGSVMEKVKIIQQVDVEWFSQGNSSDQWQLNGNQITRSDGNFISDGFSVGDVADFITGFAANPNSPVIANITINSISADGRTIVYTLNSGSFPLNPDVYLDAGIRALNPLTALVYNFGLNGNSESFNTNSKVSGNNQGYYGSNIGFDTGGGVRDLNWVNLQRLGKYKDWQTGSMRVRYLNNPTTYVQRFEIEHELIINPYYLDGELSNLQNNIIPTLLNGINSLKYVYDAGFRTVLSNPNTQKNFKIENNLGSVAWFNENFNGFNNNYSVKSISYEEAATSSSADGILIGSKTRVIITVENLLGAYTGGERFGVYVSYLPQQNEYTDTTLTDLVDNFIYDRAINNEGIAPTVGSDFITLCESQVVSGDLEITLELEYSSLQKAFLSNRLAQGNANYLIAVEVGDVTLPSGNSDRVLLLADAREYDESADIPDLMGVDKFDIYPHDKQIGVDSGFTDMTSWNEDGLVVDFDFHLDLNKSAFINSLQFMLVAYNPTTDRYFELDSYSFGAGTSVVSGGVQQLNANTTRGYILKSGDQFNDVQISVSTNAGNIQQYIGRFAQKIAWQDWISNLNVDTIFYNNSEPNNNLNNKSSNYSLLNGYEVRLAIFSNLDGVSTLGVSGNTNYLFLSPTITVFDYEEDGGFDVWSCNIETFNFANSSNLGGAILTGQDTLFRSTWTNSGGAVTSLTGLWGINRIEETGQQGYDITEMSSLNDPLNNGILKPNSGTKLFVYLNAGKVVFECLIDGNKVAAGQEYNLSSRIHDTNFIDPLAKLTSPDDSVKDTSGTIDNKQQS